MVLFTQEFSDPPLNKWRPCASCHAKGATVTASQPSRGCSVSGCSAGRAGARSPPGTVPDGPEGDVQDAGTDQLEAPVPTQARDGK